MKNLSVFPSFQKIGLLDYTWYNDYYKDFEPFADHSPGNAFTWLNFFDDLYISNLNNNLLYRYTDVFSDKDEEQSFSILGKNNAAATLREFYSDSTLTNVKLKMLSSGFINTLDPSEYLIEESRNSWDYIYLLENLIGLSGGHHKNLRNILNSFNKQHFGLVRFETFSIENEVQGNILLKSAKQWRTNIPSGNDPENIELRVLQKRLQIYQYVRLECHAIYISNTLEGFLLYSFPPQKDYVIAHHLCVNHEYKNIFDYVLWESSKMFQRQNKIFLNAEQDLGKPGLRERKERLRPIHFLKKYSVSLK